MSEDKKMLADRIQKSNKGFSVIKDGDSASKRIVYYGTYTLKEEPWVIPELEEMSYWKPMDNSSEIILEKPCFVYVAEKNGDETVEDFRFYWTTAERKPGLEIVTNPASKKYGEQAFEIIVTWTGGPGEAINNEYIFLQSQKGEKYSFLRKTVGRAGVTEERYIYIVPEGHDPDAYFISYLPQLKEKYNIIVE